jgi:hypothetical protein
MFYKTGPGLLGTNTLTYKTTFVSDEEKCFATLSNGASVAFFRHR